MTIRWFYDGWTGCNETVRARSGVRNGYGESAAVSKSWKNRFEMRKAGISKILLYRTNEFDAYCTGFAKNTEPSLTDVVMSWERLLWPATRAAGNSNNDTERRRFHQCIRSPASTCGKKLDVQESSWNNAFNGRRFNEAVPFGLACKPIVALGDPLWYISDIQKW